MKLPLWRVAEFIDAAGNFDGEHVASGYSIDSRTIQPGDLFFAVKGERLDGHEFVVAALKSGALAAVIAQDEAEHFSGETRILIVKDTLAALQRLGAAVRRLWGKRLIGVTGSAGKTTTKDVIAHLLAVRFRVLKSLGNLNNHFGLPLQLLKLESEHDIAVIEMGMSHAGEIAVLCEIAKPEWGVVTSVAPVHLEFFPEGIAGIARAKYELIAALPAGGVAFLNADDPYVSQFGRDFHGKVVQFGIEHPADVGAKRIEDLGSRGSRFQLLASGVSTPMELPLLGRHNVMNALAGIAVALEAGVTPTEAAASLLSLKAADKRGQVMEIGGATLINDSYNSNPKALDAMVDVVAASAAKRRIVVAGEMLELGPTAPELHRESGNHIAQRKIDILIGVRGHARFIVEGAAAGGADAMFLAEPEQAGDWLADNLRPGDVVLLKASRGVRLEGALERLNERLRLARPALSS
ncbi:MAG: UDP-N-acetylmuramoyl-tripeptide--D-alanyl-D-alanine ligase [Acidobacteria bacterium]|nr:MAG: UDP-N-acetylmuramoyl-tripeptide--D-alanyl-D-alanine ligase [Acidobacteriota bacterium]